MLPRLTVNRHFMPEFVAAEPPCLALGLADEEAGQCALVALRLDRAIPRKVSAAGFRFGHSLLGAGTWEVVHFAFEFYGFASNRGIIPGGDDFRFPRRGRVRFGRGMPPPVDPSGLPRPELEARLVELLAEVSDLKQIVAAQRDEIARLKV